LPQNPVPSNIFDDGITTQFNGDCFWNGSHNVTFYGKALDTLIPQLEGRLKIKARNLELVKELRAITQNNGRKLTQEGISLRERLRMAVIVVNQYGRGTNAQMAS
jgi:hypothetical protein